MVYAANRGNRAASIFSEYDELPRSRTRIVVEVPIKRKPEGTPDIYWEIVEDDNSGRRISVGIPEENVTMGESSDQVPKKIDDQIHSNGLDYGLEIDQGSPLDTEPANLPNQFLRELQEHANLPQSPPVPPSDYNSSPVDASAEDTIIIDLCNEESEEEDEEPRELPHIDLTQQEDPQTEEDYEIIASATRGWGGHRALSIRSRSLSTILGTPARVEKRGRRRPKKVQTR
jgi:hypothetical protein